MRKLIFLLLLFPSFSMAQTPTPTNTPDMGRVHRQTTNQAFFVPEVTILPTAVPTAYGTPQLVNKLPLQEVTIINDCDVNAHCDPVGDGRDYWFIPPKSADTEQLGGYGLHHSGNVGCRGDATCNSGRITIEAKF